MKIGTNEPKKVAMLAGLIVVAVVVWFMNRSDEPSAAPSPSAVRSAAAAPARPSPAAARNAEVDRQVEAPRANVSRSGRGGSSSGAQEFRPSLRPRDPNMRVDPASIDPTLKLELLAKLKGVSLQGGQRSLFDFTAAPPPPAPKAKTPEPKVNFDKIKQAIQQAANGATPSAAPVEPPKPPPTPIPLKFFGFTNPKRAGAKRAFFLDGEDIVVATEGEVIKKRYKIIRIGLSSAIVEDTEQKNQQTLPLVSELNG